MMCVCVCVCVHTFGVLPEDSFQTHTLESSDTDRI